MADIISTVRKLLMTGTKDSSVVLTISDLQAPFQHHRALEFLCRVRDKYNPTRIVCIGDEADYHALGDYPTDPDGMSAGDEQAAMQKFLMKLWNEFPDGDACISNHTLRPYRRAFKHGIPESMIKGYHELLKAPPAWKWSDRVEIDGVIYEHGDAISGNNLCKAAIDGNHQSTVFGHHTKAQIEFFTKRKKTMFAMCIASLIDERKYAFKYGSAYKNRPNVGTGVVIDGKLPLWLPIDTLF